MPYRENISYLVPRDPSIKCWDDRVKLSAPRTKNLIQLGLEEFEETMGDKIKVYLRLKPCNSLQNAYTILSSTKIQTEAPKESISYKNVTNGIGRLIHKFTFTSVLDQNITQADLFKKCAVKSLKKFLNGENYLLMAYGTTSAGKTFTMQGNIDHPGVIPRALDFVFSGLKNNIITRCRYQPHQYNEFVELSEEQLKKDQNHKSFILSLDLNKYQRYPDASHITIGTNSTSGFSEIYENITFKEMQSRLTDTETLEIDLKLYKYAVWISMIEIYNEQVYDLLELPNEKGSRPKLMLRDDEYGNTFVKNLRYVNVSTGHEAFQILQFGRSNLHLAPTALNHNSSRSHCIFIITLAKFIEYETSSQVKLNRYSFCDLAGMERAKKTLNMKDRLVESKAINTSLSILVKCLTTIKENQNNKEKKLIPYRESKLTKLFRDAVTGKEQFSLIVNVTTEPNLFDETLSVLKFSSIAQKIVPQQVFIKPKIMKVAKKSRFSRIVSNACNNTKIIDWDDTTTAYDSNEIKENTNEMQELQNLIEKLKGELAHEKQKCREIENDIRQELTNKFSEILTRQRDTNISRLESERERLAEMYERKEKRLIKYYEFLRRKKRPKLDDDDAEFSQYQDVEEKLQLAQKEIDFLNEKNEALLEKIQTLSDQHNKLVSECSALKFTIVDKDKTIQEMKRTIEAKAAGGDSYENELRKQLEESKHKTATYKTLLDEAAVDYKELEEHNNHLRSENEVLEQDLAEQRDAVEDHKNEIVELQKMLAQKRIRIEKLESTNEKLSQNLKEFSLPSRIKENSLESDESIREELKLTSEKLKQSVEELEALKSDRDFWKNEVETSINKIVELQNIIVSTEKFSGSNQAMELKINELSEKLNDAQSEMEKIKLEKLGLEEKCREFNSEIQTLQKEIKHLIVQKADAKENDIDDTEENKKEILNLQKELENVAEDMKKKEREAQIHIAHLEAKLENAERETALMKNLKKEAEHQIFKIPRLEEEIKKLESKLKNEEKNFNSLSDIHQNLEENEKLRNDIFLAHKISPKDDTPSKFEETGILLLSKSTEKKDEVLSSKAEGEDKEIKEYENGSMFTAKAVLTPNKLSGHLENLSLNQGQQLNHSKSTRKKIDLLEETIHPSTIKNTNKGRKKNGKKEKKIEEQNEKESLSIKKKGKCFRQLYAENDYDGLCDLNCTAPEEIPRLRPRK